MIEFSSQVCSFISSGDVISSKYPFSMYDFLIFFLSEYFLELFVNLVGILILFIES